MVYGDDGRVARSRAGESEVFSFGERGLCALKAGDAETGGMSALGLRAGRALVRLVAVAL